MRRTLTTLLVLLCVATTGSTRTFETRDEAFARLFPAGCNVERETEFLTDEQVRAVEQQSRTRLEQARITYYIVSLDDSVLCRVYLDTHKVRSMKETLLVALNLDGSLRDLEILAFHEPEDYLPTPAWYELFEELDEPQTVQAGNEIDAITGATLTVNATCHAVRRVCSIDALLYPTSEASAP